MASSIEFTPQERLAISRKAIVRHMNRRHQAIEGKDREDGFNNTDASRSSSQGIFGIIKHAATVWWHRHPANAVAELARPLLSDYARAHPFKLLGFSAAAGVATVVIRPWRMVSVGSLLIAAVKSSGLTNTLISMISSITHHSEKNSTPP